MFVLHEEKGQGLMEYGLILDLVAIIVVLILGIYGSQIASMFSRVTSAIDSIQ